MSESEPNWTKAIELVRQGDEQAAKVLVDDLYPTVIRIVRSHLPSRESEEDLAQEVFMKVFSKIDTYSGTQPFPHWVSRVAINTCYDRLRHQRVRKEVRYADLGANEHEFLDNCLSNHELTPPSATDGEAVDELLSRLLATLNPRERMVIQLLDLQEKSVQEACDLTGWGLSKVKVTAMRARRKLSESLRRLEQSSFA